MTVEQARKILEQCTRNELADYTFGDCEVVWKDGNGTAVADGYFGRVEKSVSFPQGKTFTQAEAEQLRYCGNQGAFIRNDKGFPGYDD